MRRDDCFLSKFFDRSRSRSQVIGLEQETIFMGLSGRRSLSLCVSLTCTCSFLHPLLPSTCYTGYENKSSENKMHLTWDMGKVIVASSLCLSPSSACLLHKVFHDLCMFPSWSLEQPNKDSSVQGDSMVVVVFCFYIVICRCYLNASLIRMKNSRVQLIKVLMLKIFACSPLDEIWMDLFTGIMRY